MDEICIYVDVLVVCIFGVSLFVRLVASYLQLYCNLCLKAGAVYVLFLCDLDKSVTAN